MNLPQHTQTTSQDAPLGSGIALLLGLGGAYLVAKRRKED
jgi:LPXTG-motif cell wall-anchored protein